MNRVVATVLLCLSMVSIVDGGLLRPCQCGSGDVPACGSCPADLARGKTETSKAPSSCCGCHEDPAGEQPGDEPDGCRICPGPREPREAPAEAVALVAPGLAFLNAPSLFVRIHESRAALGERPDVTPLDAPWRFSPEGLSVFLT